jgi:hypothetical protein
VDPEREEAPLGEPRSWQRFLQCQTTKGRDAPPATAAASRRARFLLMFSSTAAGASLVSRASRGQCRSPVAVAWGPAEVHRTTPRGKASSALSGSAGANPIRATSAQLQASSSDFVSILTQMRHLRSSSHGQRGDGADVFGTPESRHVLLELRSIPVRWSCHY